MFNQEAALASTAPPAAQPSPLPLERPLAAGPTLQLWLSADHQRVLIQIWDAYERLPGRQQPEPDAEHGRGLFIVAAVSESCGTYRLDGDAGKIV